MKRDKKQERIENFERQREKMKEDGFKESSGIISVLRANVLAFVTAGPFCILAYILHALRWGRGGTALNGRTLIFFFGVFFITIFIHELLHGLGWSLSCKKGWKSIAFGMMWSSLTPYCHCKEPLRAGSYSVGLYLPFCVLGLGLFCISMIVPNYMIFLLSVLNMLSAGGDLTIGCYLLKHKKGLILDHPTDCGFISFEKSNIV
ncbi:DUF3267 domain-containing protein [Anaerostipes sp.]|uniref:DUF3267 domain-containing protein n=1 Tax=Anaerostipes sp. TaxID=1872530 RepID=UPI0025BB2116|nr:DUF3267 domain-containing protein [Anaerostipes sp.]MBS7009709.1 DUF3267 domain-containing protein [Anaerostipes sp.]